MLKGLYKEEKNVFPGENLTKDKVVQSVMNDLNERSKVGIEKYNTTLDREDLSLKDWLNHLYEEQLDACLYTKRSILKLENK